ncbi:MAG: penicillin-binding protein 2 [Lachnospiraceae bacterium]|nr:penicillin-binding protein 2 [Lachnospiraceae bacterium]
MKQKQGGNPLRGKFTMKMQKKLVVLFFLILLAFLGLGARLAYIATRKGDEYTKQVLSQQRYESTSIPYKRGDILDAKGTTLAASEKVYNLIVDCYAILEEEAYMEATLTALKQCFPGLDTSALRTYITENPSRRYYVAAKQLSYEEISDFVLIQNDTQENPDVKGIWFEEEYRRVYPGGSLASDILGFTIKDDVSSGFKGNYGLEAFYNDILNGTNGREYGYLNDNSDLERTTIAAIDGYNLVTTIDANIQGIVERNLEQFNETYTNAYRDGKGAMGAGCIIMDVDSGEILAMADAMNYDLNDPSSMDSLIGNVLLTAEGKVSEEKTVITEENAKELLEDTEVLYANLNSQWKNFCITNTYEPGSTAKPFTMAAGLESGTLTGDEWYTCNGLLEVADYKIRCSHAESGGCGTLSMQQALEQSCNVCLMLMGEQIGKTRFLEYQERFHFGLKTNIDLAGESRTQSLVFNEDTMGVTELATSTFGQGYNTTMIQMISAFCSLINGGYYYEPHMVSRITTGDGALVQNIEPRVLKQTVSESTSQMIRQYCLGVVENGTGRTARPAGYRIGGKTGTAEMAGRNKIDYVVSFMGYAPAEDPEIAIYVVVDRPNAGEQDDAKFATRLVRSILTEVLPYMNIFMTEELSLTEQEELAENGIYPSVSGNDIGEEETETEGAEEGAQEGETEGVSENTITNANGGDITSSVAPEGDEGETAPMTGTLLDPDTGEALHPDTEESP